MDLTKFESLMGMFQRKQLGQDPYEWRCFLEFISAYFVNRKIDRPIIVEIGIWNGLQRRFYEELLGAEYIGIDNENPFAPVTIKDSCSIPDIVGDSHNPETVEKLKIKLAGCSIDLLFIDGDHSYESVKLDYELYEPFVKHIIAFHDIYGMNPKDPSLGVYRLWNEIIENEKSRPLVIFKRDSSVDWIIQMGIGCIVKGGVR